MKTQLTISVKKFDTKDNSKFYALSTKLYAVEDTAKTNGTWYKVYPTKEMKAVLEEQKIVLNRPFTIDIDENDISVDQESKKLFLQATHDFVINFIKTDKDKEEKRIPSFSSIFQVVKVG